MQDPLGLKRVDPTPRALPLMLGAYVQVEIETRGLDDVFELPRRCLRESDRVWIAGEDDKLTVRQVTVAWKDAQRVIVSGGVQPGDRILSGRLAAPLEGMEVRVSLEETKEPPLKGPQKAAGGSPGAEEEAL